MDACYKDLHGASHLKKWSSPCQEGVEILCEQETIFRTPPSPPLMHLQSKKHQNASRSNGHRCHKSQCHPHSAPRAPRLKSREELAFGCPGCCRARYPAGRGYRGFPTDESRRVYAGPHGVRRVGGIQTPRSFRSDEQKPSSD